MSKKLFIKTYGCQMNVYDSNRMQDLMNACGYENAQSEEDAQMVIINTCHIREKATEKLFSDLGRLQKIKEKKQLNNQEMIVAVAGCVAQAEGEEIFKRAKVADIIVGPESYQTLPDLVGKVIRDKKRQLNLEFIANDKFDKIIAPKAGVNASAFITIQEGCDKFCTFCVVPYTRGAEYCRSVEQVYQEALQYANQGVQEVYFLGQNVNAYKSIDANNQEYSLAKLIEKIASIDKIKRIRYTTSHPRDMSDDLINAHRDIEKLMPFLHLPVQSGSNNILQAMNRKHTRDEYFKIIDKLRKSRPDIGLSSDFIVGFPGETDKDFEETLDLVKKIGFTQCYSFKYSPRHGTPSADSKNQVEEKVKDQRLAVLQELLTSQQVEFNKQFEGKKIKVLFEKEAPKSKKKSEKFDQTITDQNIQIWGKSEWLQSVVVNFENGKKIDELFGKIFEVDVVKSRPSSLIASL
ncbi:tRNA-2-methylthio-N(6)-dimethylallyladenosine synthase [Alphaproteobacteria bacterium]|nr:tRNA-2-methylthio-N(6)-dimethylallyladenosine synthase [Alphaproteobacteria bacterium]